MQHTNGKPLLLRDCELHSPSPSTITQLGERRPLQCHAASVRHDIEAPLEMSPPRGRPRQMCLQAGLLRRLALAWPASVGSGGRGSVGWGPKKPSTQQHNTRENTGREARGQRAARFGAAKLAVARMGGNTSASCIAGSPPGGGGITTWALPSGARH